MRNPHGWSNDFEKILSHWLDVALKQRSSLSLLEMHCIPFTIPQKISPDYLILPTGLHDCIVHVLYDTIGKKYTANNTSLIFNAMLMSNWFTRSTVHNKHC